MVEITVKIPESIARSLGETSEARSRRILEDAAIEEYRSGRLSHRQVGEALGLDYWETERFLADRQVPINYGPADCAADEATLDALFKSA